MDQPQWGDALAASQRISSLCVNAIYKAPELRHEILRNIANEMNKITAALHLRRPGLSAKAREVLTTEAAKLRERFVSGEAGASTMLADAVTAALSLLEERAP